MSYEAILQYLIRIGPGDLFCGFYSSAAAGGGVAAIVSIAFTQCAIIGKIGLSESSSELSEKSEFPGFWIIVPILGQYEFSVLNFHRNSSQFLKTILPL